PGWLQDVHRVLPIRYMADLVRYALAGPQAGATRPALAFAIVGAWCAGALVMTSRVAVSRR
ncbi:MAG TPA: hypothetical protein VKU88_05175, partial [Acidimicrobiales bacterium]|nr:hypothetical protein [Acidimicrobiales bacterium]